jgi:ABC-type branched-subunit amino acid transport system substrate-binding protein
MVPPRIASLLFLKLGLLLSFARLSASEPPDGKTVKPIALSVAILSSASSEEGHEDREIRRGVRVFNLSFPEKAKTLKINFWKLPQKPSSSLEILQKLKNEETQFLIGLNNNEQAMWISDFAEKKQQIFIAPRATYSKIAVGKKNSFQLLGNEILQGAALAKFAIEDLKRKKILILVNQQSVFSQSLTESLERVIGVVKSEIKISKHLYLGAVLDLEGLKKKIKSFSPDLVFISDEINSSAVVVKYIHQVDPLIPFLAADPFDDDVRVQRFLKDVPKMRIYFSSVWDLEAYNQINEDFRGKYHTLFKSEIRSAEAGLIYDSLRMLNKAIELAGGSDDIDKVRYFLERATFETTQGQLSFKETPSHSPIREVHLKVSNIKSTKSIKTLRSKWKENR